MERNHKSGRRRPPSPAHRRRATLGARPVGPDAKEAFRAQTFPHVEAVYADALCLTGRREDAADLVVVAYLRAFHEFRDFQRAAAPRRPSRRETLAWLYRNLHAAFCDHVLTGG